MSQIGAAAPYFGRVKHAESGDAVEISLDAVIVAVGDDTPRVLTVPGDGEHRALPSGLLDAHSETLELALRRWIREQAGLEVGYVEQLYTFGDTGRSGGGRRVLSIAYLALTREERPLPGAGWTSWYDLLPWEDHRIGRPDVVDDPIWPALGAWADDDVDHLERARIAFGLDGVGWDGVRVLERYELLYEIGLLAESSAPCRDLPESEPMLLDHRRIVATALGRLRGKLTYRPVVFELLPERFSLLQLQRLVEALAGVRLHKQNFRRLVEAGGLVERTGAQVRTGGRPAELFRFRREVLLERPRPGVGTPWTRG